MTTTNATDPPTQTWPTLPDGRYPVLRCCHFNGTSSHGFTWPLEVAATAVAPDWDPNPGRDCGAGLHGLLWGCGSADLLCPTDGVWMVVAVDPADIATPLDGGIPEKVRFRAAEVLHVGDRASATGWLVERASGLPIVYGTSTSGYGGTSTSGYRGTSTSGAYGTSTSGAYGTSTSGVYGTSTSGAYGTSTSGYGGTSTSGYCGTSTSGYCGTSTSGVYGMSTSGACGMSTSGVYGTSTSGYGGVLIIQHWDGKACRRRIAEVDGTTIRAGVAYRLDDDGNFVEATAVEAIARMRAALGGEA